VCNLDISLKNNVNGLLMNLIFSISPKKSLYRVYVVCIDSIVLVVCSVFPIAGGINMKKKSNSSKETLY